MDDIEQIKIKIESIAALQITKPRKNVSAPAETEWFNLLVAQVYDICRSYALLRHG